MAVFWPWIAEVGHLLQLRLPDAIDAIKEYTLDVALDMLTIGLDRGDALVKIDVLTSDLGLQISTILLELGLDPLRLRLIRFHIVLDGVLEAAADVIGRIDVTRDLVADAFNQSVHLLYLHEDLALNLVGLFQLLFEEEEHCLGCHQAHF